METITKEPADLHMEPSHYGIPFNETLYIKRPSLNKLSRNTISATQNISPHSRSFDLADRTIPHQSRVLHQRLQRGTESAARPRDHVGVPAKPRKSKQTHKVRESSSESPFQELILQPDSRPISQEQLAAEVKGIYAGLVMVENKCIDVYKAQYSLSEDFTVFPNNENAQKFSSDHWQALIALHRTLLHEHHDFFLASQHPSASPALRRLATKYSMPARMWKHGIHSQHPSAKPALKPLAAKYSMPARMWEHGIHSFLELLRRRLPESLDYMLAFIYLAYQMMALLYETVPDFEDTWIECLGDLGRYRMAIEDEDVHDCETWAGVARSWYSKATNKRPSVGRLYHHLAILARPNALQQPYYYTRSLMAADPFSIALESIMTLLNPINHLPTHRTDLTAIDARFIKVHALLFGQSNTSSLQLNVVNAFIEFLDEHIGRIATSQKTHAVHVAVTGDGTLFDHGSKDSAMHQTSFDQNRQHLQLIFRPNIRSFPYPQFLLPPQVWASTRHLLGDDHALPFIHTSFTFFAPFRKQKSGPRSQSETRHRSICVHKSSPSPRKNKVAVTEGLPVLPTRSDRPLPEDYLMHGQLCNQFYFYSNPFETENGYLRNLGESLFMAHGAINRSSCPGVEDDDRTVNVQPVQQSDRLSEASQHQHSFRIWSASRFSKRRLEKILRWTIQLFHAVPRELTRNVRSFIHDLEAEARFLLKESKRLNSSQLSKLLASSLLSSMIPVAGAATARNSEEGAGQMPSSGTFGDNSLFDSMLTAFVLLALLSSWLVGRPARPFALAITLSSAVFGLLMAGGGEGVFSDHDRWTVVKTWAASSLSYISLTYSEARNGALYLLITLILFGSFATVGTAIQQFSQGSILNAVPPSLSLASFLASLLPQSFGASTTDYKDLEDRPWTPNPLDDIRRPSQEYTDAAQAPSARLDEDVMNQSASQTHHRYESSLPAPSLFEVGSDDQSEVSSNDLAAQPRHHL